ncbi:MAG: S-layer homology domain-containing protein [Oscillospiraceae bacterium]|nr:S-layer homology domain-containing protein [Oscillospiraceae bacterium]
MKKKIEKTKPGRAVRRLKCTLGLLLALAMSAAGLTGAQAMPADPSPFPDVPEGAWYADALLKIRTYTPGIISGKDDGDGVLRFHPEDPVLRGEFLKMSMTAAEAWTADHSRDDIHWAGVYYTMALENNVLIPDAFAGTEPMFPCTREALEQPISRYEMAVILTNACTNLQMEPAVTLLGASAHITDYDSISAYAPAGAAGSYVSAVEQAYGKGLLSGFEDGSFRGTDTLTRAQAVTVIYRQLNWKDSRQTAYWASESGAVTEVSSGGMTQSFAQWLQDGHIDAYGKLDAEARTKLFGSPDLSCFWSAAQADPYMETVTIPIWVIDKTGNKYGATMGVTVNKMVADEIVLIFEQIYNDEERFPIYGYSVGGARYTDTMRHSWGCAIDINPYYNCECNFRAGYQIVTCGYGWWPYGMEGLNWCGRDSAYYRGTMTEPSPYSIAPGGSVVRAFADYGWGWGGSGTNDPDAEAKGWGGGMSFDFMHFSVLPSGG